MSLHLAIGRVLPRVFALAFLVGCAATPAPITPATPSPIDARSHAGEAQWQPAPGGRAEAVSPDGRIKILVSSDGGQPGYRVLRDGAEVIGLSRLGLRFAAGENLDTGLVVAATHAAGQDTVWEQPWGERRLVIDRHNELAIKLRAETGPERGYVLRVRVFDEGAAFRYEVEGEGPRIIVDEISEFTVPGDATAWWTPAGAFNRLEYTYRTSPVSQIPRANTPLTLRTADGVHLAIHEAALIDYAGMWLDQRRDGKLEADLAPRADGSKVHVDGAFVTPWRVIQIADTAPELYNGSDIYLNLNAPNTLGDVSYFQPGKYIGIWWGMHIGRYSWGSGPNHGATTDNAKRYIDFAAEHGFSGVLVEGWNVGWDGDWFNNGDLFSFTEAYPDYDFEALAEYAAERGTALIGHHETSGNLTNYERQIEAAMDLMAARGVSVIKTGYVADGSDLKYLDEDGNAQLTWHDSQERVVHDIKVLEAAHARGIAINAHEPARATGLRRTYPNAVSREGARGMEFNAWGTPPNTVEHQAILPYTRMLAGPFDYTPGIFDLMPNGPGDINRVPSTLAKQLALYVTIYSPVQMAADLPENYLRYPDAFQFIKDVPADWEHSKALQGEVGDYFVIARKDRASDDWYLGGVTDEAARTVSVPLEFLEDGAVYTAQIYRDGRGADWETNPYEYTIAERVLGADDTLVLPMAAGGGFAVRFTPQSAQQAGDIAPTLSSLAGVDQRGHSESTAAPLSGGTLWTFADVESVEELPPRDVFVWTPPGYETSTAHYPVIYMHDGQNLFQPGAAPSGDEWRVDETLRELSYRELASPAIVVGIASTQARWQEYAPAKAVAALPGPFQERVADAGMAPTSDAYLRFVTSELKPMVDRVFRTKAGRDDTYTIGASMGGLIALYALSEYPEVFGAAAGLSTHWPIANPAQTGPQIATDAMKAALDAGGIDPALHRIWLDRGTENLDSFYGPYAEIMDTYFEASGFEGDRYASQVVEGSDHNEASWAERFPDAVLFLLGMGD
ncbi:MAG: alpha/beta fold hydrolase [Pseudomonadota bacterium]